MNTPSHFLINYSLGHMLRLPQKYGIKMNAVGWGSLAPDVMLYLLSVIFISYYRFFQGWGAERVNNYVFDVLFFENIWWILLHNFFQAPLVLLSIISISILCIRRAIRRNKTKQQRVWLWILVFSLSALLHTILDILTHHDDGPLLLFPFNFTVRFRSPVSYWNSDYHGKIFAVIEGIVDILCIGYLVYFRWMRRGGSRNINLPQDTLAT